MNPKLLLICLLFPCLLSNAQPTIQWQKSLGGTDDDVSTCIRQTSDGGYIVCGDVFSKDGDVTEIMGIMTIG